MDNSVKKGAFYDADNEDVVLSPPIPDEDEEEESTESNKKKVENP